ncbi:MAG TPA: DUF533 domain-containing protein [Azospirillaceae bacterium]|nr:DUF533 domain-containing protein [Azospirillaceae bacterium]
MSGQAGEHRADAQGTEAGRRGGQGEALLNVLAQKVLRAHLQNRHQLLDPPPADLGGLEPAEARLMLLAMIAAGHADGELDGRERQRILAAIATSRLDQAERHALSDALEEPPALEPLLRQVAGTRLAPRFYAVSLVALRDAGGVGRAYLAYIAARLSLPADLVVRYQRRFRMSG